MTDFPRSYSTQVRDHLEQLRNELRLGRLRLKDRKSSEIFVAGSNCGSDTGWVEIWSDLGELLTPLAYYFGKRALPDAPPVVCEAELRRALEFAGGARRLVFPSLDERYRNIGSDGARGRELLRSIIRSVDEVLADDSLLREGTAVDATSRPLSAEEAEASLRLVTTVRWVVLGRMAEALGIAGQAPVGTAAAVNSDVVKFVWLRGILDGGMPTASLPGALMIARAVARNVLTDSALAASIDDEDPYAVLHRPNRGLPLSLAEHFSAGTDWLRSYREGVASRYGYEATGIEDPGLTELDRLALRYTFDGDQRQSLVVLAPTSSGKSRLGQIAVSEAVHRRHGEGRRWAQVVFLVPTKALVAQVSRDLRALFAGEDTADWVVMEGSRDHPQFDDHLRVGKFDVAVCIPEKLTALLRIGMSLADTPLVVLDEMQHLVDSSRGLALQLLMLDLFHRYPELRWIGLSASLSSKTKSLVGEWFDANGKDVVVHEASFRPVPLSLAATNGVQSIEYASFLPNQVTRTSTAPPDLDEAILAIRDQDLKRTARSYRQVLDVTIRELIGQHEREHARDDAPSILVFTSSRIAAERLADCCAVLIDQSGLLPAPAVTAQPFVSGRFGLLKRLADDDDSERLAEDLRMTPPGRLRTVVERAVRTGIGFHTVTLDADLRETVEEAFRRGNIRVLFATDTLKLGVNLPADCVINADYVLNEGAQQRLLDKDSIIQRLGRAGRLGLSQGLGRGHLVVPKELRRNTRLPLVVGPEERLGLGGAEDASDKAAVAGATDLERAFHHYLYDWGGGADYSPPLNDLWLRDALLRELAQAPQHCIPEDALRARGHDIFRRSLAGLVGRPAPADTVTSLESDGMVRSEGGMTRLTRLGRVAAVNALGLAAAPLIAELADAAVDGAGPLTLLYVCCLSDTSRKATHRMVAHDDASPRMLSAIVNYARKSLELKPEADPAYFRLQPRTVTDVVGHGSVADGFRAMLTTTRLEDSLSGEQATALWRATSLLHWWGGRSFRDIEAPLGDRAHRADESDLRQLAENVANTIASVSDYLGTAPSDMTFRSLLMFSQELEIGLPHVLVSLVRIRHRSMHRERLLGLIPALMNPKVRWDDLGSLIARYVAASGGVPQGNAEWHRLTPDVQQRIVEHLEGHQRLLDDAAFTVWGPAATQRVPRRSAQTMADELRAIELGEGIVVVERLLSAFGVRMRPVVAPLAGFEVEFADDPQKVLVLIAGEKVDHRTVEAVLDGMGGAVNAVIITTRGATVGVMHHSRFMTDRCAVVEPSLFLEMVARVYGAFELDGQDGRAAYDDFGFPIIAASDEVDIAGAARLLRRMMLNNAPMLTRNDLESRISHDNLAS